jgi:hypothetical protein
VEIKIISCNELSGNSEQLKEKTMKSKLNGCGFTLATSIVLWVVIIALLASCKTSEQLYNKAKEKPNGETKVAELARKDFPCITTKIDSIITVDTLYDSIEVECDPIIRTRVDSFETVVVSKVKVRVPREVVTIRTTEKIEDSAKIKVMYAEIQKAAAMIVAERKLTEQQKLETEKERKAKNKWRKWCLITWGILGAIVAFRLLRSKIGF